MNQGKDGALPPIDDIPEARRDGHVEGHHAYGYQPWILAGIGAAIALLASGVWVLTQSGQASRQSPQPLMGLINTPSLLEAAANSPDKAFSDILSEKLVPTQRTLLGHRAYEEAAASELVAITADGSIRLRSAAAEKFQAMANAARRQGIVLVPLSGFRSQADQEYLFFGIKEERAQAAAQRAEVSAPPGYSEHHTGYAIDIGDAEYPQAHLQEEFAETPAFEWLEDNANRYGFELSFKPDNSQGVVFEPWHWRFVGNRHSLETFYQEQP